MRITSGQLLYYCHFSPVVLFIGFYSSFRDFSVNTLATARCPSRGGRPWRQQRAVSWALSRRCVQLTWGFRERSIESVSRGRVSSPLWVFVWSTSCSPLFPRVPPPQPPTHTPLSLSLSFTRIHVSRTQTRLWSWLKIPRCLARTRFTAWRKMSTRWDWTTG